jgi:hypothetical protein
VPARALRRRARSFFPGYMATMVPLGLMAQRLGGKPLLQAINLGTAAVFLLLPAAAVRGTFWWAIEMAMKNDAHRCPRLIIGARAGTAGTGGAWACAGPLRAGAQRPEAQLGAGSASPFTPCSGSLLTPPSATSSSC